MNIVEPIKDIDLINDIADFLKEHSERDYVLFLFGIYSGLRIGDILKLKVRDVKNKDYIFIQEMKTEKLKRFIIHDELKEVLHEYCKDKKDYEYLFKSRQKKNKPISRERAYQVLREAAEKFGLDCIGCHTMRKTFGYFLYQQTKNIVAIKEIFNHSDIGVTLRYIGMQQDEKDKVMSKLSYKKS